MFGSSFSDHYPATWATRHFLDLQNAQRLAAMTAEGITLSEAGRRLRLSSSAVRTASHFLRPSPAVAA